MSPRKQPQGQNFLFPLLLYDTLTVPLIQQQKKQGSVASLFGSQPMRQGSMHIHASIVWKKSPEEVGMGCGLAELAVVGEKLFLPYEGC